MTTSTLASSGYEIGNQKKLVSLDGWNDVLAAVVQPPAQSLLSEIDGHWSDLQATEQACVSHARPKRIAEFATGRKNARKLLTRFGIENCVIPADKDRCPVWPEGIVGSIAHSKDYCLVAVACERELRGIGVDIESAVDLESDLWPIVLTDRERDWLSSIDAGSRGLFAKVLFSAKESFYKCWFPRHRRFLEFQDVAIDLGRHTFAIEPRCPDLASTMKTGAAYEGRWTIHDRWTLTSVTQAARE